MITIENLPEIEGGTDKQQMYAQAVRLKFISFVEENISNKLSDAELVVLVRRDYRWWINHVNNINLSGVKAMIKGSKAAVTRAGSIEAALEAQRVAIQKAKDAWLNSRPLGGILDSIYKK